jgi:hypothetical protein
MIQEILDACDVLNERVLSLRSAEAEEGIAVHAIEGLIQLITQNVTMQRTLLLSVESSLPTPTSEVTADGGN